ncbi:putative copper-transporting ATPase [Flavihumibacter petaseus NBRC 106054]|uniref:Putative copper-transporting ATPase n=1 Tax=Flavihumibacter petaseus NBRC 106054 TaxID=1220578 RepID=A0A0E9N5C9_9BACT|nr:putative copper-transporting ATPase [Flavihumibacter petaseus NBRC 106054]
MYTILKGNGLCRYYDLNQQPGLRQDKPEFPGRFGFLDQPEIAARFIRFESEDTLHLEFYLPQMHCNSCLYLLEKLPQLDDSVLSCTVHFTRKEVSIVCKRRKGQVRRVAELLTHIGYEPYISLSDLTNKRPGVDKSLRMQLGVAGFCFSNIMLMSFPEYFGIDSMEQTLQLFFRWFNLVLAIPVVFYSAIPFYRSTVKSLRAGFLHIDAPIALAIVITFTRSVYEVFSHTGAGYFDSLSGIVFFMLLGRVLQDKSFRQLSFERDYTSYFPIAVNVKKGETEDAVALPDLKPGDTVVIRAGEIIPADGILTSGEGFIDYAFVTGESMPVHRQMGELLYAGGRQSGGKIEMLIMKEVVQSYLASLWNKTGTAKKDTNLSFVHALSKYFTWIVLAIAMLTAAYWEMHDVSRLWQAVTAVFIVACPCALLLANSFTNGNILGILSRNDCYLRNAGVIESLSGVTHIVFDKTGTLTRASDTSLKYTGAPLPEKQLDTIAALASGSGHPLSLALARHLNRPLEGITLRGVKEFAGKGIEGYAGDEIVRIGNAAFTGARPIAGLKQCIYLSFDGISPGYFTAQNRYRDGIEQWLNKLKGKYKLSVLSGDNAAERHALNSLLGRGCTLYFDQKPEDKRDYIRFLQDRGEKVLMIGDGLNDAAALEAADAGIAVSEDHNNFTPASDGIMQARSLPLLPAILKLGMVNKRIVMASFILSLVYNIAGLFFAVRGVLSPMVAAILMPASTLSIFLVTFGASRYASKRLGLTVSRRNADENHPRT